MGFVHYIAKFTISRFVISRFECTKQYFCREQRAEFKLAYFSEEPISWIIELQRTFPSFFVKKNTIYMYYIHTYVPKYLQCTITIYVFSRSYNLLLVYWVTIYILLVGFLEKNSQGILNKNCNSRISYFVPWLAGQNLAYWQSRAALNNPQHMLDDIVLSKVILV